MDDPPPYNDSSEVYGLGPGTQDDVHSPTTLYVAGRFIHSTDPWAPPLYELSHSVGFLKDTDRSVRIERLDYSIKRRDGVAQLAARKRHIYDLKHPLLVTGPTFAYHAEPTSRQSLCAFGLEKFRPKKLSPTKGYRIRRATHSHDHQQLVRRDILFSAVPTKDKAVRYEWSDADGQLVAREVNGSNVMTLVVSAMMGTGERDALVSAWMSRVWAELAKKTDPFG
ncbi:uncharacterized protein TRIVIDRAFT_61157 [Trichoderma virens Gv29-8]|uniref:Uncharacterized protein n=1 Tax=Hypocrea virens (strain Gv29-8 / FGSC 10586) TaxID=413071 RepID=G9MLY9_HYPVG|nr:uncharacterized protein TRIVIDRAFT_61157 [Trichoderma virens Gv29-8]EHK24362.1 hypothetical protein TRIVIDRAFT_61157 [Trichoderma virens Gv29-8]UKZ54629.1 hypothetical protein TrVGV298_008439 [Trichoderma virens]